MVLIFNSLVVIGFILMLGRIVIVIFGLMPRMIVVVVTTRYVIMIFLIHRMDVRETVNVFVHVFVKMVVLNLS
ncbi:MAG: hypothetical protein KKF96_03065, partial [Proteobacteria bacterium]|nr:hypothetical protein [Pseudomonadota bacterium]